VSLCVAFDDGGHVVTSTSPMSGGRWQSARLHARTSLGGGVSTQPDVVQVSCPSVSLCVAADSYGQVISSTNPAGGTGAWRAARLATDGEILTGVACPSVSLCVIADSGGHVFTSTDPASGAVSWHRATVDRVLNWIAAVSCPSTILCVMADGAGNVLTSTDPTGGRAAWHAVRIANNFTFDALSCPSASMCVAFGSGDSQSATYNTLLSTTDPTGGRTAWSADPLRQFPQLQVIRGVPNSVDASLLDCSSPTLCVGLDNLGDVLSSTSPTDPRAWTVRPTLDTELLADVSCGSLPGCVGVDGIGNVLVEPAALVTGATPPLVRAGRGGHVTTRGRTAFITAGLRVTCPARGSSCRVAGSGITQAVPCGPPQKHAGRIAQTIPAGATRAVVLSLPAKSAKALNGSGVDIQLIATQAGASVTAVQSITVRTRAPHKSHRRSPARAACGTPPPPRHRHQPRSPAGAGRHA
jgi:hypothetical protein